MIFFGRTLIIRFCAVIFFFSIFIFGINTTGFGFSFANSLQNLAQDTSKIRSKDLPPYAADRYGTSISQGFYGRSPLLLPLPSLKLVPKLDTTGLFYNLDEFIKDDSFLFRPPSRISFGDYQNYRNKKMFRDYWKAISVGQDGKQTKDGKADDGRLIPPIQISPKIGRFLGGNTIDIQMNGSMVLDFGGLWQRVDNPQLPIRQRRNGGFNFDQQIGMNVSGKIGQAIQLSTNFDTKSTFQFEQKYNLGYKAYEHDIVQDVQLGNVSFPVSNSLISGAQNLFGVTTKLRFGKLWLKALVSSQRGSKQEIKIKNGAQSKTFEIRAHQYESNRHFFLAHFFRDNYTRALQSLPAVASGVVITRVEAYITNRSNNTQTLRNVVALMDLGEGKPFAAKNPNVGAGKGGPARNDANQLFESLSANPNIRNPDGVNTLLENGLKLEKGTAFELLRGAQKLDANAFSFHPQLGYISLRTPLRNDEILAVSFEYSYNGQVYKVGELTEDYGMRKGEQVIFLKMLSPSTIQTDLPVWQLMMKNIYNLQAHQLNKENFQLNIIYKDDATGIDNPSLHEGNRLKDVPLVQIMGLDRLNQNGDPQKDGNFDFLPGLTVNPATSQIIFPVLEPFGNHLQNFFNPTTEKILIDKYVFSELYNQTQADAQLNTTKNKFFLSGSYQSGASNEIILPGITNIAPNSVVVRVGNSPLTEGVDYTVDYQFGRIRIMNEGAMSSGREITIQYERADLFSFQTRNLLGVDAEYHLNKDVRFSGTMLYLNERPIISRVNIGSEPVRNMLWGFGIDYKTDSRLLTKMVDKLPFLNTKAKSSVSAKLEFAQLIPGSPRLLRENGTSYIDDFEGAEIAYNMGRSPQTWALGATPKTISAQSDKSNPLSSGYKRAKLAWYSIDNLFYSSSGGTRQRRPASISDKDLQNHYVRPIPFDEVFPNKQRDQASLPEVSFDLAYYPKTRGPYNFNPDLTPEGKLKNPKENFGAITRAITNNTDFDNINIQYVEFWLMDPFLDGKNGEIEGKNNTTGGSFYLNLGNVSEDVMPDGRHFFENGLKASPSSGITTDWGKTPTQQYLTDAFDATSGTRAVQDVGLDGLSSKEEAAFFKEKFLDKLPANLRADARAALIADPSGDDFRYFLGDYADKNNLGILARYKHFNGTENNSPESSGGLFTPASTNLPDNEDLNRDNTISDLEQYYQYKIELKKNKIDRNRFVVGTTVATAPETGEKVRWYQFRIPIRGKHVEQIGNIKGYKSIRFMRMFLTGWQEPVVLRMVNFQLVGAQWRPYAKSLKGGSLDLGEEPPIVPNFRVSTINIEENGQEDGINTPYTLPPDALRDYDAGSTVTRQLNEQSLKVCVDDLKDDDGVAVYKNVVVDMVNYKRLKMDIHAESPDAKDHELSVFVRLGSDFDQNYYEIEMPLVMTPIPSLDPQAIWPQENRLDIALKELYLIKAARNRAGADPSRPFPLAQVPNVEGKYTVRVKGNPDISAVQTVLLGIKNPDSPDNRSKSACVWFNELRVTDFDNTAGWAVNASINTNLADFASVRSSLRYSTVGFGGIQDKISNRQRSTKLDYDISSNINLDKFLLEKIGITLPLFVSYQRSIGTPYYDPLNPDLPLAEALTAISDPAKRSAYKAKAQDLYEARSINLSNIRKIKMRKDAKKYVWDIENISLKAAYSDSYMRNIRTEAQIIRQWELGATYAYNGEGLPIEPFKKSKMRVLKKPYLRWLKEMNFNLMPTTILVSGSLRRKFMKTQLRNKDLTTRGMLPQYQKTFTFDRNYVLNWALTRALTLDYTAVANAIIDEPQGDVSSQAAKDSIIHNLRRFGRMKNYQQTAGIRYTLPLDKFPLTDFMNAEAQYTATYQWAAGAVGLSDSLGNKIDNTANLSLRGRLDMKKLYDKVPIFKQIGAPKTTGRQAVNPAFSSAGPADAKKKRLQSRLEEANFRRNKKDRRLRKKLLRRAQKDSAKVARDSLKVLKSLLPAGDTLIPPVFAKATFDTHVYDSLKTKKLRKIEAKIARLRAKLDEVEQQKPAGEQKLLKTILRPLIAVKDVGITYTRNAATILPGFLPTPVFLGMDAGWHSPGLPFILGSQNDEIKQQAALNGWLGKSIAQNQPFAQTRNAQIGFTANVEPLPALKIQLNAKKNSSTAYSEIFRYQPQDDSFVAQTPSRTGSYGISFMLLKTAFVADDGENNSPVFAQFVRNRRTVKRRLDVLNPAGEYQENAQDVLIPAFLAAYTGADAANYKLNTFPKIPIPNWRLTYTGLSKIPLFKEIFKSVSLTHGYSADYKVGNYTSSLFYGTSSISMQFNERDVPLPDADKKGNLVPVFIINQVALSERFAPLIGINLRTENNMQVNLSFNKSRGVVLNLSNAQVTENRSNDLKIDLSYTKKGLKLPFSIRGMGNRLKNNVIMRLALTLRDTRIVQRKIDEGSTVTAGNMNLQVKPTISYAVNKRANIQLYFQRTINNPKVSNSFRRTTTAFGVQFRYNLSQ